MFYLRKKQEKQTFWCYVENLVLLKFITMINSQIVIDNDPILVTSIVDYFFLKILITNIINNNSWKNIIIKLHFYGYDVITIFRWFVYLQIPKELYSTLFLPISIGINGVTIVYDSNNAYYFNDVENAVKHVNDNNGLPLYNSSGHLLIGTKTKYIKDGTKLKNTRYYQNVLFTYNQFYNGATIIVILLIFYEKIKMNFN